MAVVLEIVDGAASQHDVCQDVTAKAVEHGAEPGGHGTPAGHLHRTCSAEERLSATLRSVKGSTDMIKGWAAVKLLVL